MTGLTRPSAPPITSISVGFHRRPCTSRNSRTPAGRPLPNKSVKTNPVRDERGWSPRRPLLHTMAAKEMLGWDPPLGERKGRGFY